MLPVVLNQLKHSNGAGNTLLPGLLLTLGLAASFFTSFCRKLFVCVFFFFFPSEKYNLTPKKQGTIMCKHSYAAVRSTLEVHKVYRSICELRKITYITSTLLTYILSHY